MTFDAKTLTDEQLTECLFEMRRRGAAVPFYDANEIMTMTDGWEDQPTLDQVKGWFDKDHIESIMCEAVHEEVDAFLEEIRLDPHAYDDAPEADDAKERGPE